MTGPRFADDFRDLIVEFADARVDFLIIGGHAVAHHGHVRATIDLDLLVRPSPENAARVFAALVAFGAPLAVHGVLQDDFAKEGTVYQVGLPPRRIDVLTSVAGVSYDEASAARSGDDLEGRRIWFIGREALLLNKRASGRRKDLADVEALTAMRPSRSGASRTPKKRATRRPGRR